MLNSVCFSLFHAEKSISLLLELMRTINENASEQEKRIKKHFNNQHELFIYFENELSREKEKIFSTIKAMINEPRCCGFFFSLLFHTTHITFLNIILLL